MKKEKEVTVGLGYRLGLKERNLEEDEKEVSDKIGSLRNSSLVKGLQVYILFLCSSLRSWIAFLETALRLEFGKVEGLICLFVPFGLFMPFQ